MATAGEGKETHSVDPSLFPSRLHALIEPVLLLTSLLLLLPLPLLFPLAGTGHGGLGLLPTALISPSDARARGRTAAAHIAALRTLKLIVRATRLVLIERLGMRSGARTLSVLGLPAGSGGVVEAVGHSVQVCWDGRYVGCVKEASSGEANAGHLFLQLELTYYTGCI